ncbi:MAG: hypothetical protein ACRENN_03705 [Candidatus Eiseniibacteriota bacterium]
MTIPRFPVVMLGLSLAILVTADVAPAQTPIPKASVPSAPLLAASTHHVKGTLQLANCPTMENATLRLVEYWYVASGNAKRDLIIPYYMGTNDQLMFNGNKLVQGKTLASVSAAAAGAFDMTWSETATAGRKPWAVGVQNQRTGETITVYRLLRLEAAVSVSGFLGTIPATPEIQFFGTETTKDVGAVKLDCVIIGG